MTQELPPSNPPDAADSQRPGLLQTLKSTYAFLRDDLWDLDLATLPRLKKIPFSIVRIVVIVIRGLIADHCALHASALSYTTLISMVPVLALMFSVSKGFGVHERLMATLAAQITLLPEKAAEIIHKVFEAVERTNFGALGIIGLLLIFWTSVKVLGKVENTFNSIWGVHQPRTLIRKFTDYISVLVVVPILMLAATSANTALKADSFVALLQNRLGPLYWIYERLIGLTGLFSLFIAFSFLYIFIPNTRVKTLSALAGGVCGGGLWFLTQKFYIWAQVFVTSKSAIYGTFAAVPFFLAWLYASWLIVLFGAEISFAIQNHRTYWQEGTAANATLATRQLLGLLVVYKAGEAFMKGGPSWCALEYARQNEIPIRLMTSVIRTLTCGDVLLPVEQEPSHFVPARDLGLITPSHVLQAFRGSESSLAAILARRHSGPLYQFVSDTFSNYQRQLQTTSFRDLLQPQQD